MKKLQRLSGDGVHVISVTGETPQTMRIISGGGGGVVNRYKGDYEVTPRADSAVILETAAKLMTRDVTVKKIPFHEVANDAGGNTTYIGSEVI